MTGHDSEIFLTDLVHQAIGRGLMELKGSDIVYHIHRRKKYRITDPEEQVRADTIAYLTLTLGYNHKLIDTEIQGSHNDYADIVLFSDEQCQTPYLVVENKKRDASPSDRAEGTGQAFANANALRAKYALTDFGDESTLYDIENYPPLERVENKLGDRSAIPVNFEHPITFRLIAGNDPDDISPFTAENLELQIKRAHAVIWAGGKRDPLVSFEEWSKLMFSKIYDERYTPNGRPRQYQIGVGESESSVASRIHKLFEAACNANPDIFPKETRITLPDAKIVQTVRIMQEVSFIRTDADTIGIAFESFYGSVFRGQLGQYFTMRPITRFIVSALQIGINDNVLDPTCGSGGFLLETLLQVWNQADREYSGRSDLERLKSDFTSQHVYDIEIHEILARICKINLLLHHDGHTNIEADKSCLSPHLTKGALRSDGNFQFVIGNPPFGTKVSEGDLDQLDGRSLIEYDLGKDKQSVQSEHIIIEMGVRMLEPGGTLGMVLPDGSFNNSGGQSNCPAFREWLFRHGRILGVVSLPDYAFRHSGATNKTSILLFQKFNAAEQARFDAAEAACPAGDISNVLMRSGLDYQIMFAEANYIGYTASGLHDARNDLYNSDPRTYLAENQQGTILAAWRQAQAGKRIDDPRCTILMASKVWDAHPSHRIDPKYHVYKAHATDRIPNGWIVKRLGDIVERRLERPNFAAEPQREFRVLTLSQSGDLRLRAPGAGNNPPEWLGMYFADSSSDWYTVRKGDIVYSGIDLWKGAVCYVTDEYDGALVTSEYPILRVTDSEISPRFLFVLLRSGRFRRAFRAINTGHSNRRRTQEADFNNLNVFAPSLDEQERIANREFSARATKAGAQASLEFVQSELDELLGDTSNEQDDSICLS